MASATRPACGGATGAVSGGTSAAWGSLAALPVPAADHQFTVGDATTIHLQAGESKVVYAGDPSGARAGTCTVKNPAQLRLYDSDLTVGPWHAVATVSADSAGDYPLECTGPDGLRYSIGGDADTELTIRVSGAVACGSAALVGIVLVVATAVRRRRPSLR